MDHLSEEAQNLIQNPNPRDMIDFGSWTPVYDEEAQTLSSSPPRIIGMKRSREVELDPIEPNFKNMRLDSVWHEKYITSWMRCHLFDTMKEVTNPNPKFYPRYLAKRMPLPDDIISYMYNTLLNQFDRDIIEGEHVLIQDPRLLGVNADRLAGASSAGGNAWYLAVWNCFDEDHNSPH